MIKPFQLVWEIFVFGLQALFLYVLALILCIGLIGYTIADRRQQEPTIIYEKVVIEKEKKDTICARIAGWRVLEDGTVEW